jgi:Sugar (pentulose and hexulose) kinases
MQNVGVALERVRGWLSYEWADAYRDAFGETGVSAENAAENAADGATDGATENAAGAAAKAPAGLTFLPYLTGERTPWLNPAARGGWLGLALDHTRGTMMRAAFEGVAFSLRAGLDAIRASGANVTALKLAGGGSVDARWRQLLADALNVELYAVDCPNAAPRGAAILGALAKGHWHASDLAALAPGATRVAGPQNDAALAQRYARFLDLYGRVETWFGEDEGEGERS